MDPKTIKEIAERRAAIQARKAEINDALAEASADDLAAYETEVDNLNQEDAALENEVRRAGLTGRLGPKDEKPKDRESADIREQRGRELREKRAITIASGDLAQPKKTGGINDGRNEVSSIVDLVNIQSAQGMMGEDVAFVVSGANADKTAEGAPAYESDPVFEYAPIRPVTITTYSEISREALKLTDLDYYGRVTRSAYNALRKKAGAYILLSDDAANPVFQGIFTSPVIDPASDMSITAIDATTLRKVTMRYGGDENIVGGGVLLLNKEDLIGFGDVRGTNEKKAIYEITPDATNPNTGMIQDGGLAVRYVLNSNITPLAAAASGGYVMAYGAPGCFQLDLFSDYTVRTSEDAAFRDRMIAVLGEAMIGGNVVVHNGFQRVKKG